MDLHQAARNGDAKGCRSLLAEHWLLFQHYHLNVRNSNQRTPLHLAALGGSTEVCRMLIEAGAAVEAQDDQQETPLHVAAQEGHVEVCRVLIEAGAAVEAPAARQCTPLHLAALGRSIEVCRSIYLSSYLSVYLSICHALFPSTGHVLFASTAIAVRRTFSPCGAAI
jgi:ankyrin repeat protein